MSFYFKILFLSFLFFTQLSYAEEISLTEKDVPFINEKSNNFITNMDYDNFYKQVSILKNNNYDCIDFKNTVEKVYPEEYIKNRCIFKYSYEYSRMKGLIDATNNYKDKNYISKIENLLSMEDYETEGVNGILNKLKNINPIESDDINKCKSIANPYSSELPVCMKKIYTTENNTFMKYMQACDQIYSDKKKSDICMVNLGNKSFDPFDRVETKCFVNNYYSYTDNKGNIFRRLDTGPYYQCLSYKEKGEGFVLWKAQMGYREGYTAGLYIIKTDKFNFLKDNNE